MLRTRALASVSCLAAVLVCVASCSSADRSPSSARLGEDRVARLANLSFSRFVDEASLLIVSRSPQSATFYALAECLGTRNDTLDDYSRDDREETANLILAIGNRSRAYDRDRLSGDEQITYDAWTNYIERAKLELVSNDPLSLAYCLDALCVRLRLSLTIYHPFRSVSDVEDYLARLKRVGAQLDQILGILDLAIAEGKCPSRHVVIAPVSELTVLKSRDVGRHILYLTLLSNLLRVPSVDTAARKRYLERARDTLTREVIPAAERFCSRLVELSASAPKAAGVSDYAGGHDDYERAVGAVLGVTVSCDEIHEMALTEVDRRQAELLDAARALSLPGGHGALRRGPGREGDHPAVRQADR